MFDRRFTLPAFAKINFGLRVLGRRPDNLHEIRTVFQTITLHDQMIFQSLADGCLELTCSAPDIAADESNLVHRAAVALSRRYGVGRGARIELEKTIPAGGGLGGGSSDAAVALIGLSTLWGLAVNKRELEEIGATLGADVPFFLTGGTALGTGSGTDVFAVSDEAAVENHLVVIAPGLKVGTAEAYKALNARALTKVDSAVMLPISRNHAQIVESLYDEMINDFEPVVFRLYPEIKRARDMMLAAGARRALLSGSGSSVFGIFSDREGAAIACAELRSQSDWRVFACATLSRAEYRSSFGECARFL